QTSRPTARAAISTGRSRSRSAPTWRARSRRRVRCAPAERGAADVQTEVLIVGAGPTGLMLANQLVRRGVRTLLIDRHAGPAQQTRALGVQARTLEIYAQLGIVERALELGKRGTGANIW